MRWLRYLRRIVRLLLMVKTIALFFLIWALGLPFVAGSKRRWSRWRATILQRICRTILWLMGARIATEGEPPPAPFVLVSNHLSYIDILVLASRLETVFVSKAEIAKWPVIGILCQAMGTVFIKREQRRDISRVLAEMEGHLDRQTGIVFFPEGTSTNGTHLLEFRPSLLEAAVRLERPVYYASLQYQAQSGEADASDSVCWWGDRPFMSHFLHLVSMPGFDGSLVFGPQPIVSSDRKKLAVELHQAVAEQLSLA